MLLDDEDVPLSRTKRSTPAPRATRAKAGPRTAKVKAAPKTRGKKVSIGEDEDEDEDEDEIIQFDDDEEEEERPKPKKSRATASRYAISIQVLSLILLTTAVLHQGKCQRKLPRRKAPRVRLASYLPVEDQELPLARRRRFVNHLFLIMLTLMIVLDRGQRL